MKLTRILIQGLTLLCFFSAKAEEIKIPVVYRSPRRLVKQMGFQEGKDKYVWAVKIPGIEKAIKGSKPVFLGFYLNADAKNETGRFATAGYDYQFNISYRPDLHISFTKWTGDKKSSSLPVYPDDFLVRIVDDVFYLVIKKSIFKELPFVKGYTWRVLYGGKAAACRVNPSQGKIFFPVLNFDGYGIDTSRKRAQLPVEVIFNRNGLTVWDAGMERYGPMEALPKQQRQVNAFSLSAARGESESLLISATIDRQPGEIIAAVDDFKSGDASIAAKNVKVNYVGYVRDRFEKLYPDVLYNSFRPQYPAKNNFVLLTVKIPRNAKAGKYSSKINLQIDGKKIEVPVKLRVFDFSIPETPSFITAFSIKSHPGRFYSQLGKPLNRSELKAITEYSRGICREHRIGPRFLGAGAKLTIENDQLVMDWNNFDKALKKFFKVNKFAGFQATHCIQWGSHSKLYMRKPFFDKKNHPPSVKDARFQKLWPQYVKELYQRLQEYNRADQTLLVIWDEPYADAYKDIITLCELAKKTAPGIKLGAFISQYVPELAKYIDVWAVPASMAGLNWKKGRSLWMYNDPVMGGLKNPASDIRGCFWLAKRFKIEGFLNSEINCWHWAWPKAKGKIANRRPTHSWIYPNPQNKLKPLSSLRLALIRDGLDDYDYLQILSEAAKSNGAKQLLEQINDQAMPRLKNKKFVFSVESNRKLNHWRKKIAEQIEKVK